MLVNHTVAHLAGGVTQQFDESAPEVQVREMINCVPSMSRGVLRRNPVKDSVVLSSLLTNRDYFVYAYDRGTEGEQYLVFIGNGELFVFNAITKALIMNTKSSYLIVPTGISPKDAFSLTTINDFTFIVNKYVKVLMSDTVDGTLNSHLTTGIYYIKRTTENVVASTSEPKTVGSTTYFNAIQGNLIEGYSYRVNSCQVNAVRDTRNGADIRLIESSDLITELTRRLNIFYTNGGTSCTSYSGTLLTPYKAVGPLLYRLNMGVNDPWVYLDSFGNDASYGFKGIVQRADMLPDTMPAELNGTVVNISNSTPESIDDYWLKYTGTTWTETRKPGMKNTIAPNTMPHVLVRSTAGDFYFTQYTESALGDIGITNSSPLGWKTRQVGDEVTCPNPSFVNNYITQVFFHRNRLGFISKDNVIMSENGEYGNFFGTTVMFVPETDPIDITIASTEVSYLDYVIPNNSTLILFANNAQYILHSGNNILTPTTATIDVASRYHMPAKASPRAIGNKIFYIAESGGNSQLFFYNVTEGYLNTQALKLTESIPAYIPKDIKVFTGNSSLGYIFLWSPTEASTIYVYNFNIDSKTNAQSAFHKWEFARDIIGVNILDNTLYVTFINSADNSISVGEIDLELPSDISIIDYTDNLGLVSGPYESSLEFTKWFVKDQNANGTKRGRLQLHNIQYSISHKSYYSTYIVTEGTGLNVSTGVIDGGTWNDDSYWDDNLIWTDSVSYYTTVVDNNPSNNQPKITVLGNSKETLIVFKNDRLNTSKGFELETINFEGFLYQQSQRI